MDLRMVQEKFVICQVADFSQIDLHHDYVFTAKTKEEYSVICPEYMVPEAYIKIEHGWKCFNIAEDAAFEKYGMIAFLADIVAKQETGILVAATFDTDYIFIKQEKWSKLKRY